MSAVERVAGRALVVAPSGRALMIRGEDPDDLARGGFWFTPGGGLDDGETIEAGIVRELREEIGLVVDELGPVLMHRVDRFSMAGVDYRQTESIHLVEVDAELTPEPWDPQEPELSVVTGLRWLGPAELRALGEHYYPRRLAELLEEVVAVGPPATPWVEDLTGEE